ncbi:hypothetical protein [Piscinibacter sp. XHJ-5]|uniref:hypothetical protein n=1 Tax=Piscinibacter sp. XHJ-5 TaxID=3037797 RepID=UPI0024528BDE|nr:hypothetical protein [Piscinibacter sp. XHJ-5]
MLNLTSLGVVHTAFSLVAVLAGLYAMVRYRQILPATTSGRVYVITTVITCLTGFGIFQHGGFGPPHVLGVLALIALIVGAAAGTRLVGRASRLVQTIAYSTSFFFHWVPGIIETTTRLPAGAPIFASQEATGLQVVLGVVFALFVGGVTLQVRSLRREQVPISPYGRSDSSKLAAPR